MPGPARARRGGEMADAGDSHRTSPWPSRASASPPSGRSPSCARGFRRRDEIDCRGGVLMPGLVDSHTHGVFGRPRYDEQELRAAGLDYMEIARRGGGIHSSVRDLRTRSEDELFELARAAAARVSRRSEPRPSR